MQIKELNCSISQVLLKNYVVPLYQRNYAWGEEEIYQLMQDIFGAFKKDTSSKYYIGSLVVLKRRNDDFEVIDGQQRLTTISLIAKILDAQSYKIPKLKYDSRPEVEGFLQSFYQNGEVLHTSNSHLVSHFKEAMTHITTVNLNAKSLNNLTLSDLSKGELEAFRQYFFNNVIIVKVEIPSDTDVAHYFEVMNNRGEQLEKHEILKARLLDKIKDDTQSALLFSKIWDACSQMNVPIQKLLSKKRSELFGSDYNTLNKTDLFNWNNHNIDNVIDEFSIREILNGASIEETENNDDFDEEINSASIIDFPNFLMHVFKIHLEQPIVDIPLNEDELLSTYEEIKDEVDPKSFIEDLLYYRVVFDRFIIKSFDDENEVDNYRWSLLRPERYFYEKKNQNRLVFKNTFEDQERILKCLSMLQVTFRTRKYKNWLQEVLSWFKSELTLEVSSELYLKKLNALAFNIYQSNDEFKEVNKSPYYNKGTRTPHFLFNFINYLMWLDNKGYNFDFKYYNSVEHHLPQSFINDENKDFIDNLGNLCLVSKSGNSKMNNEHPEGKASRTGKYYKESLPPMQKSIYERTNSKKAWGVEEIKEQYAFLIELLERRKELLEI
jgi:uncharacterized protein with ParB-like and HNH nuclease domain